MTSSPALDADDPVQGLRLALVAEARIAEALGQRSRALVDLIETLARRALDDAADLDDARRRFAALAHGLREGLAAGETAEAGDMRRLAEETLGGFDFGPTRRIVIDGPPALLAPEARRLTALALFDLAGRSSRFGALATEQGTVTLSWRAAPGGGLTLTWSEIGARPGVERMRRGAGGPLIDLLTERFGAPLRLEVGPCLLKAELTLPARDLLMPGPAPARVLVALGDAAAALTLSALLLARGVGDVAVVRTPPEAAAVLAAGGIDLVFADVPRADGGHDAPAIRLHRPDAPPEAGRTLWLPVGAGALAAAMAAVLAGG